MVKESQKLWLEIFLKHNMSRLFIKFLKISCLTNDGDFGCEIPFTSGLNIIRAENSSGKSTCLNTILYALGLEAILGKTGNQALKPAVKSELSYEDKSYKVLESFVELEIENEDKEVITVKRQIKGEHDDRLISVTLGGRLSERNGTFGVEEYFFVRDSGAAQRERGFHNFLAKFLNLSLPIVETYDGNEVLLYLECIFPSFFIEQRRGWSNIQATIPSRFRIKNVAKTVTEYILNLDVNRNQKIRKDIEKRKDEVKAKWLRIYDTLQVYASEAGGILNGFSKTPVSSLEQITNARIFFIENNRHISLSDWIFEARNKINSLKEYFTTTNNGLNETSESLKEELKELESSLFFIEASNNEALNEYNSEKANKDVLIERLESFEEDLIKNQDALKLKRYGANIKSIIAEGFCPTCHQEIEDSLLEQPKSQVPMSIENNIQFIKQQKEVVSSLLKRTDEVLNTKRAILLNRQDAVAQLRQKIQDIKTNLTQDKKTPNISLIRELITSEEKLKRVIDIREKFDKSLEEANFLCHSWREIRNLELEIPKDSFSNSDKEKLQQFAGLFRTNIVDFGFRSENPTSIAISRDTYRPTIEGFEMAFDASASDNIRLIWAYTLALQEISDFFQTNHLKISFFDEPAQQQVNSEARKAFYGKMGTFNSNDQFITTTSESEDTLFLLLKGVPHTIFEFGNKVLSPTR